MSKPRKILIIAILTTFLFSITSCQKDPDLIEPENKKIKAIVSILPQKTFLEKILANKVEITVMVPPGANPATYEPLSQQLKAAEKADIYIQLGSDLPFENIWLHKLENLNPSMIVINSGKSISLIDKNPHIWLSPPLVQKQIETISQELVILYPQFESLIEENSLAYLQILQSLDAWIQQELAEVEKDSFIDFHPSWRYYAENYGIQEYSIEVEGKSPTAIQLKEMISFAKSKKIHTIIVQKQFSQKYAQTIAEAIQGQVVVLDPLREDYCQNLKEVTQKIKKGLISNEK